MCQSYLKPGENRIRKTRGRGNLTHLPGRELHWQKRRNIRFERAIYKQVTGKVKI